MQDCSLEVDGNEALSQAQVDVAEELLCAWHVCWRHAVHDLQHVQGVGVLCRLDPSHPLAGFLVSL